MPLPDELVWKATRYIERRLAKALLPHDGGSMVLHSMRVAVRVGATDWAQVNHITATVLMRTIEHAAKVASDLGLDVPRSVTREQTRLSTKFPAGVVNMVIQMSRPSVIAPQASPPDPWQRDLDHFAGIPPLLQRIVMLQRMDLARTVVAADADYRMAFGLANRDVNVRLRSSDNEIGDQLEAHALDVIASAQAELDEMAAAEEALARE